MKRPLKSINLIGIGIGVIFVAGCVPPQETRYDNSATNPVDTHRQIGPLSERPIPLQKIAEPSAPAQIEEGLGENLAHSDPGLSPDLLEAVEVDREDRPMNELASEANAKEPKERKEADPKEPKEIFPPPWIGNLAGRSGATREKMLRAYGGSDETERAVALALAWLAKQQLEDGSWKFDVDEKKPKDLDAPKPANAEEEIQGTVKDTVAATGLALLPFLAAGETHRYGKKYTTVVRKGLEFLADQLGENGHFKNAGNYSQAIATIPFCEVATMTSDVNFRELAQKACDYIVKNQDDNGSWGYSGKKPGDTSILGWQIQALQAGKLAGLKIPDDTFKNAEKFLISVASESESQYGYSTPGGTPAVTAVGHLCRQYMGKWSPRQPGLARGIQWMWLNHKPTANDMYYTYYASQVFRFFDGPSWHKDWNPAMQKALLPAQVTEKTKGVKPADIGSWNPDKGIIGSRCGRLGTTALTVLTLEVYYRHLPLYKREPTAPKPPEK